MIRTCWVLGAAAAAILWMGTGPGRADDDTLKLDLRNGKAAATMNLLGTAHAADTVLVGGHGGHGHGGGHAHAGSVHAAHFHGGHVYGGHFHDGHFHHGGAFGSIGLGFGYWPRSYYPYYYPYYYPSSYYSSYAYGPLVYYYPENVFVVPSPNDAPTYSYPPSNGAPAGSTPRSIMPPATGSEEGMPAPRPAPKNQTYPYDGGPANPVPIPQADPAPGRKAGVAPAPEARLVGIESKRPKYRYQAYGDKPAGRKVSADRQVAAKPVK